MSPQPYLLGLTGNIAAGKSVVRQYLENAGALTVDADRLAQATYLPSGPAYQPILDRFGEDLKMADGQINRSRLGRIVFSDPQALQKLEGIVHPLVSQELTRILETTSAGMVVIEAIKLFESDLAHICQQVWTVVAADDVRLQRLVDQRGMSEAEAWARIQSQPPQEEKVKRSDRVISTDGSFKEVFDHVQAVLHTLPELSTGPEITQDDVLVRPLSAEDLPAIAPLIANPELPLAPSEVADLPYRWYGSVSALGLWQGGALQHLLSWKIEHFLAMLRAIHPSWCETEHWPLLLQALSENAQQHACKALVIPTSLVRPGLAKHAGFLPGDSTLPGVDPLELFIMQKKYGRTPLETFVKPL